MALTKIWHRHPTPTPTPITHVESVMDSINIENYDTMDINIKRSIKIRLVINDIFRCISDNHICYRHND